MKKNIFYFFSQFLFMLLLLSYQPVQGQVSGNFTINSAVPTGGGNFQTFADAVASLGNGVNGPVVFTVEPGSGPYNEQVVIPQISGASENNTITFNGNGASLISSPVYASPVGILFDGADHLVIDSLVIDVSTGSYGYGIMLYHQADSNIIRRNTIITSISSTDNSYIGILFNGSLTSLKSSGNNGNYNLIEGNTVTGGYYGILLYGIYGSTSQFILGNKLVNNKISNAYESGIELAGSANTLISGNEITCPSRSYMSSSAIGIYQNSNGGGLVIEKNRIHNYFTNSTSPTFYAIRCGAGKGTSINKIENNLVYDIKTGGSIYGIYTISSNYINIYHNTLVFDDVQSTTSSSKFTRGLYTGGSEIYVKNNIIYISRGGAGTKHCLYYSSAVPGDNNILYMASAAGTNYVARIGSTNYASFADWQATGNDLHSFSTDPQFVNAATGDYSPANSTLDNNATAVGVHTDIVNHSRSATTPDIGAYEFGTLTAQPQNVSFTDITAPYGAADFVPGAASISGLEISYEIANPAIATIVNGKLHIVGTGATTITARQAGNSSWLPAEVTRALTVNKAPLTITADDKEKDVWTPNPPLTVSYSGFVYGETNAVLTARPLVTTTATINSVPGIYPITASDAAANNYSITYIDGTLAVNVSVKQPQEITFPDFGIRIYGIADFSPGATASSSLEVTEYSSDNPAVAIIVNNKIHIIGAGTANITARQAGDFIWAAATPVTKTLTVSKADLTIKADNKSKLIYAVNPALTVTYTGFVYGETVSALTTLPVAATTATVTSPPGTYPITVNNAIAKNYNITYEDGILTVNDDPVTVNKIDAVFTNSATLRIKIAAVKGGRAVLQLVDATGGVLITQDITLTAGNNTYQLPVFNIISGSYIIRVSGGEWNLSEKIIKQF